MNADCAIYCESSFFDENQIAQTLT